MNGPDVMQFDQAGTDLMSVTMETPRRTRERPRPPPVAPKRRDRLLQDNRAEDDLRELRTAFAMFDQNHDGKVCREDLRASLSMLGYDGAEDVVDKIIQNGGNKDGVINEELFISWMRQMSTEDTNMLQNAYQVLDRDGDGFLDKDDLRVGFALLGEHVSDAMLDIMFNEADRNKDNRLHFEEFVDILKK